MSTNNSTAIIITWQHLLHKAQCLAARLPCQGISSDKLALLPYDDLIGIYHYLQRIDNLQKQVVT